MTCRRFFVDQITGRGIDADIDPAVLAALTDAAALPAPADLGEARSRYRHTAEQRSLPPAPIADVSEHDIARSDGSALRVRVYRPVVRRRGVLIYFHGGGLQMGDLMDLRTGSASWPGSTPRSIGATYLRCWLPWHPTSCGRTAGRRHCAGARRGA